MLKTLRSKTGGIAAKICIGLLVFSFLIWPVQQEVFSAFVENAARVGETEIASQAYKREFDKRMERAEKRKGRPYTLEEVRDSTIPTRTMTELTNEAAIIETVRVMDVGISDDGLSEVVSEDEKFHNAVGKFDRVLFEQTIKRSGLTQRQYIENFYRKSAERQQIIDGLIGPMDGFHIFYRAANVFRTQEREIRYAIITPDLVDEPDEPTDEELEEYFEDNSDDFKIKEYRVVGYFELNPDDMAEDEEVTDEEAKKQYEESEENEHVTKERRLVSQIVFPDMESAEAALKRLEDGAAFSEILTENNVSHSDAMLGFVEKGKILDEAVEEAAFAMEEKGTSEIIQGRFGPVIIEVGDILPESRTPFEDIKEDYKKTIAKERATEKIDGLYETIESARDAGDSLEEIAANLDFEYKTSVPVDSRGNDKDGEYVDLPDQYQLLKDVFKSDLDLENDPKQIRGDGWVWYEILEIEEEKEPELEEVREKVVEAWKVGERKKKQEELAEKVIERVENGEMIELVAASIGAHGKSTDVITRQSTDTDLPRKGMDVAYSVPEGELTYGDGDDNDVIVTQIISVVQPPPPPEDDEEVKKLRTEIADTLTKALQDQFSQAAKYHYGVSENTPIVQSIHADGRT